MTANNLAFVKSELRISYITIKSSHLTEAFASACGSQTNAALGGRLAKHNFGAEGVKRWFGPRTTWIGYTLASRRGLARTP